MEEVFTTQTFANNFGSGMVIGGDDPIPTPIDEVVDLELFSFDK
jgi:elongation factor P hydroxylase